jgi:hypothetical protein
MSSNRHEITSIEQHEEHEGETLSTRDREVIQRWAEQRDGTPVVVEGTERTGSGGGVLRIDFQKPNDRLEPVSWDNWFKTFDERGLEFIYQEHRSDGQPSTFFRLVTSD